MKCPKCQFEDPEGMKFCGECGAKLEYICPKCSFSNPPNFKFCGECGHDLRKLQEAPSAPEPEPRPEKPSTEQIPITQGAIAGERKYVTALFSDMSGYTAMSERLDPEEVKEITSRVFSEISKIVSKYDGFIEKFIGDAVMALFGVPKAHEDDPIRAIRAAMEIHDLVRAISPELEEKIGKPLSMHTGVNTGLVVTGEVNREKGTHGVAGDTINVAARLSSLAAADLVVVGHDTYLHAEGFFDFEALEPAKIKGKGEPIEIYKLLSIKERPSTTSRHRGLRADMIGREMEFAQLKEAAANLKDGRGSIFFIYGDSGTGKTRLIEELKSTLDEEDTQWFEGQAYAYSQNTPYFPLIDLLNRVFEIKDEDPQEKVKERVENGVRSLIDKSEDIIPYVGSLYSLTYPDIEEVSPEFWKSRLQYAIQAILTKMTQKTPAVICLEDLHWADSSSVELFRFILSEFSYGALFLCVYRPPFSFLSGHRLSGLRMPFQEIHLQDLSPSEAQIMVESLLGNKDIPHEVRKFARENVGGNPFFLEEVINAFIQSGTIKSVNGIWILNKQIAESDMPSTIHGIISARLDHLEKESKKILQEASVIGRTFLYDILKRCTLLERHLDKHLPSLERLDLIRARSIQPDLEYIFKSALTHDVVYNGLLKKERQEIHERIGLVMEEVFAGRLSEFYETLAFHFSHGQSVIKAVDYLVKSGEKSLARYAVEEAHQYFKEAFDILASKADKSKAEEVALIDILNSWGYAYYYLGDFKEFINLLNSQKDVAESLDDSARLGMFYAWFGIALWMSGKAKDSYECLCNALELGENSGNQKVVGYACTWLTWVCGELGFFDDGIGFGERAQKIAESFPSDQYLFFKSLGALSYINMMRGDVKRIFEGAKLLLDYGEINSNSRSKVFGHWVTSWAYLNGGDMKSSQESCEKAVEVALDPFYASFPKVSLGFAFLFGSQFQEAEDVLQSLLDFCEKRGIGQLSELAYLFLAPTLVAKGQMNQGLRMLEEVRQNLIRNQRRAWYAQCEYVFGKVYSEIAAGPTPAFSTIAKNIGFLVRNVPFAGKKAEGHFNKAIEVAKEIGAKGILGQACLDLGLLHEAKRRKDKARECISEAINIFQECEAEVYLKQAKEALASLA
ncbi:AAA family ATPase [Thermodesulfobacteriota bacterium]